MLLIKADDLDSYDSDLVNSTQPRMLSWESLQEMLSEQIIDVPSEQLNDVELPKVSKVYTALKELKTLSTGFDLRLSKIRTPVHSFTEALKNELRKLKGKVLDKEAIETHYVDPNVSKVSKDNMEPITPKLLNKRTAHSSYIKHTQEEALVLRDIVEHVKANYPQDPLLKSAFRSKSFYYSTDHSLQAIPGMKDLQNTKVVIQDKVEAHPRNVKSSLNKSNGTVKLMDLRIVPES
ncbi:hypothetical protein Tco_1123337 [Tanacetum coccineum]|uniref:Uncharacterized protein n=1 Tax=Tanacetum coccineum TaxID=301880 RepID=A0ABQ5J322_9ASTR